MKPLLLAEADRYHLFDELPVVIAKLSPDRLLAVLAQLAACQSAVASRLLSDHQHGAAQREKASAEPDGLLTIEQIARRLNVPKSNAYELTRQNKLKAVRLGKYVRVAPDMLDQYVGTLAGSSQLATIPTLVKRKT